MKIFFLTLVLPVLSLLTLKAQTPGELTVSVTTSETGGNYAPRNIVAIWIEDDSGNFVKTLLAYAQNRKTHLNNWQAITAAAGSEYNTVDAITGATKSSHSTRECAWDGTNVDGEIVPDGTYHVWMELTDKNSTGNYASFSFTKSDVVENLTPNDVPSFGSIMIDWTPDETTDIAEVENLHHLVVYPNPGKGIFTINLEQFMHTEVVNSAGVVILKTTERTFDIKSQPRGIYFIRVFSDRGTITHKIIKK